MGTPALLRRMARYGIISLFPLFVACSSDEAAGPAANPLVATWTLTSFQAQGEDFIAQGMTMTIALSAGGAYTITVTGDVAGICSPASNCTETGTYTSTSTQLTIDPNTEDVVTFNYSIQGNTLTMTGTIDGVATTIVMTKG